MPSSEDEVEPPSVPEGTDAVQFTLHEEDGHLGADRGEDASESCPSEALVELALLGRVYRVRWPPGPARAPSRDRRVEPPTNACDTDMCRACTLLSLAQPVLLDKVTLRDVKPDKVSANPHAVVTNPVFFYRVWTMPWTTVPLAIRNQWADTLPTFAPKYPHPETLLEEPSRQNLHADIAEKTIPGKKYGKKQKVNGYHPSVLQSGSKQQPPSLPPSLPPFLLFVLAHFLPACNHSCLHTHTTGTTSPLTKQASTESASSPCLPRA